MFPWERRLRDLSRLLRSCGETYFSPDLFRQNINQFLQTSRTVTFIIQKNKASVPEYDKWYAKHVLDPWKTDTVMTWARDARNTVEKEGDLDMYSRLTASVLFSHVPDQDFVIDLPRQFVVQADINKIAKLAKSALPAGVLDAAVLQIERRWVANTLPEHELIGALTYTYARLYKVCTDLASHLGIKLDASVPDPTELDPVTNDVGQMRFIKLGKPNMSRIATKRVESDKNFDPPLALIELRRELTGTPQPTSLGDLLQRTSRLAETTFLIHGNHVPMLFMFDDNWNQIDYISTEFGDQADKFVFWRNAAKRAAYLRARAFVWIAESWIRDQSADEDLPIHKLPIIGEQLHVMGATADGKVQEVVWNVVRSKQSEIVSLERIAPDSDELRGTIYYIQPILDAMRLARVDKHSK